MKKDIKFCSTITINTDASYSSQHKVGGFAFYIVCDYFRIKVSGRLKGTILSAREAEIKAIANAFHYLLSMEDLPKCSWLIINTDCTPAIDDITMRKTPLGKNVHKMWHQLRDRTQVKGAKSKFRHVKAHNGAPDARSWVNEWCDMTAKRHMRNIVYERVKQSTPKKTPERITPVQQAVLDNYERNMLSQETRELMRSGYYYDQYGEYYGF